MGKTLTTIAIGAAVIGLAFATGGASLVGTAALTGGGAFGVGVTAISTTLATTALGSTLLVAGSGAILSGVAGALQKKPGGVSSAQVSRTSPTINATEPRKTVYGRTAAPYDIRYFEWNGPKQDICDQIVCLAGHAIESVDEIWIGNELAWTPSGTQGRFVGYFFCNTILDAGPGNAFTLEQGIWNAASCRMTGCALAHFRFLLEGTNGKSTDGPFSGGLPSKVTVIVKGAKLYDPRRDDTVPGGSGPMRADDQSTWRFSADDGSVIGGTAPLQVLHRHLGWRINGKVSVGAGVPADELDLSSFAVAANLSDEMVTVTGGGSEPRFRTTGVFSEADETGQVCDLLLAGCCGRLRDDGGQISLAITHNDLATAALDPGLTDDDLLSAGTFKSDQGLEDTPNVVRGKFTDASSASLYQLLPYADVTVASPDGIERVLPLDLGTIESVSQAERVASQTLARKQSGRTFSATFDTRAWRYKIGDVVPITLAATSWNRKLWRIREMDPSDPGKVPMTFDEEDPNFYLWDGGSGAPVQPATALSYDASNNPLIRGIDDAATTATWSEIVGTGKPADNATNSADPNSPFGNTGRTVGQVEQDVQNLKAQTATDTVPPGIPTGLSASSTVENDGTVTLTISWGAVADADLSYYVLRLALNGGGYVSQTAPSTSYVFHGFQPNVSFLAQVQAVDQSGNRSGWSATLNGTTMADTVPPAPPTGFAVQGSQGAIRLAWTNPPDSDLAGVTIYEGTSTAFASAAPLVTVNALPSQPGSYSRTGLPSGTSRYYWIAAIDTSNNRSTIVGPAGGTINAITFADFDLSIQPLGRVMQLPNPAGYVGPSAVTLQTDGKLYRYVGGAWTKDVDGTDLTAGSVRTYALAAQSVTATQMAIGDFNNLILNSDFRADVVNDPNTPPAGWCRVLRAADSNNFVFVVIAAAGSSWPTERGLYFRRALASNHGEISIVSGNYDPDADVNAQGGFAVALGEEFYFQCIGAYFGGSVLRAELIFRSNDGTYGVTDSQLVNTYSAAGNYTTCTCLLKNNSGRSGKGYLRLVADANSATASPSDLYIWNPFLGRRNGGKLIVDGGIKARSLDVDDIFANHVFANRFTGGEFRTDASLPGSIMVGNTGVSIATVAQQAANGGGDPAARINANTTTILPGKIFLGGSSTLANWLYGGDNSLFNGGAVAANTIRANSVVIGLRGVQTIDLAFDTDRGNPGRVYWTAGFIEWQDDNGGRQVSFVNPGSQLFDTSNPVAIVFVWFDRYYSPANQVLVSGMPAGGAAEILSNPNNVILAAYRNGTNLNPYYGRTIIDGDLVKTGTVDANRVIVGGSITTPLLGAGVVTADKIGVTSLSAITANVGLLRTAFSGGRVEIQANAIKVFDNSNVLRVQLGDLTL